MVEANRDEENEIELIFIEISFFEGEILKFFIFGMRIANCEENKVDRIRIKYFLAISPSFPISSILSACIILIVLSPALNLQQY